MFHTQPYGITASRLLMSNNEKYFGGFEQITRHGITKYALQYCFGAWITSSWIYAEDDAEAIFDAKSDIKASNKLQYRLMKGCEVVKMF